MHALEQLAPIVSEPLTWAEICERYPEQHVCLVDVESDDPLAPTFRRARVAGHGGTLDAALDDAAVAWELYGKLDHHFTGRAKTPFTRPMVILDEQTTDAIRQ